MPSDRVNEEAAVENALTLAEVAGLSLSEAQEALDVVATITFDSADREAERIAREVDALLSRTVRTTKNADGHGTTAAELVIGSAAPRTPSPPVYLTVSESEALLSGTRGVSQACAAIPGVLHVLIACYATAATLRRALTTRLPGPARDSLTLRYADLGLNLGRLSDRIDLGRAYMAGAGAVGNALLWAARHLNFAGRLDVVDDDIVSDGNLNRQVWFRDSDIRLSKARRLVEKANDHSGDLELVARECRIQDLPEKSEGPWLQRLIVAVDSRRARRALQNELPGEVFDASTTDIREVVRHYNLQPTSKACLSCVYPPDEEEYSREQHIAERLGVSVDEVRQERICLESASKIVSRYDQLAIERIVGLAYDTLFKQLCSAGELNDTPGKRVVAPFAFVSVLAGTLLALELVRRLGRGHVEAYNYWRVSPWTEWDSRLRDVWGRIPNCPFCGNDALMAVNQQLWGSVGRSGSGTPAMG